MGTRLLVKNCVFSRKIASPYSLSNQPVTCVHSSIDVGGPDALRSPDRSQPTVTVASRRGSRQGPVFTCHKFLPFRANRSQAAVYKLTEITILKTKDYQLRPETMERELVVEFPKWEKRKIIHSAFKWEVSRVAPSPVLRN